MPWLPNIKWRSRMAIVGPPVCLIFSFSVAIPILLGTWAISRYRQDRVIVTIGILAIVIGFTLGIMNEYSIWKYSFRYTGAVARMLFVTAMMDLLFIPLMIFGGLKVRGAMIANEEWSRGAKLLSIALAAVLVITVVGGSMMPVTKIGCNYRFSISVSANTTGVYYLYVPAPLFRHYGSSEISGFADDLEFVAGQGNSSVIETEYGPAVRISSTGSATLMVEGKNESESFNCVSLRNGSSIGYGEQYWVFLNKSFGDTIYLKIEGRDHCWCCSTNFYLSAYVSSNGWATFQGSVGTACC